MDHRRRFGALDDGGEVEEVFLSAGELTVKVITWGAVIRDLRLAGVEHPLVLGFDRFEDYPTRSPYFGAVAGRCANRIADGRFTLDGVAYELPRNEKGVTHLHGGPNGFGRRNWRIEALSSDSVTLALVSADGDQGYPGELRATCRYRIEPPGTLRFEATAETDRPTLVNLVQHSYFNLSGEDTILDHEVTILADGYVPVDERDIPTGGVAPVAGTPFDFREPRPVRETAGAVQTRYDHNYALGTERAATPRPAVVMQGGEVRLDIATTEPGVQFYMGHKMKIDAPGLDGRAYGPSAGCCFEPQMFPDAINQPDFASPILRPGERYAQTSLFAFTRI